MESSLLLKLRKGLPSLLFFILFAYFYLDKFFESMRNGKAGWEPLYDDISYINDGIHRFSQFQGNPIQGVLDFLVNPPHAPIHSVIAFLGAGLAGLDPLKTATYIYFMSGLVIAVNFFIVFQLIFRKILIALISLSMLVALPGSHFFLFEFRPDLLCAILITTAFLFHENSNLRNFYPLILSAAFLAKPTFVLYILMSYIFLFLLDTISLRKDQYQIYLKSKVPSHCLQFAPIFIYLIFAGHELYGYIKDALGVRKSIWDADSNLQALQLSVKDLFLQIGSITSVITFLLFFSGLLVASQKREGRKMLCVWVGGFLINFIIAFQTLVSTRFFYLPALVMFIAAGLVALNFSFGLKFRRPKSLTMIFFAIPLAFYFSSLTNPNQWAENYMRGSGGNNYEVAQVIEEKKLKSVVFMFSTAITNDTVQFYLPTSFGYKLDSLVLTIDPMNNFEETLNQMEKYDAVVFANADMPGLISNPPIVFPIHALQNEFAFALRRIWGLSESDKISNKWSYLLINPAHNLALQK
jgi:hypothetical protein